MIWYLCSSGCSSRVNPWSPIVHDLHNDQPDVIDSSHINLFADVTSLFYFSRDADDIASTLQGDIDTLSNWLNKTIWDWMSPNQVQCFWENCLVTSMLRSYYEWVSFERVDETRYLIVILDSSLSWKLRIHKLLSNSASIWRLLCRIWIFLTENTATDFFKAFIPLCLEYCSLAWMTC